jgi:hypothetical protein
VKRRADGRSSVEAFIARELMDGIFEQRENISDAVAVSDGGVMS